MNFIKVEKIVICEKVYLTRRKIINKFEDRVRVQKKTKGEFRINEEIRAPQVRVIDESGKMIGVFSSYEAQRLAQDRGLDLIEIAPAASPPTCRIMDYGKWKYEAKKKAMQSKKKQVVTSVKELQIRPRTDQHDLEVKLRHAKRFLLEGDKVRVNLRFLGREIAHQDMGSDILDRVIEGLKDLSLIESAPKKEGRNMFVVFAPDPLKIKQYQKTQQHLTPKKEEDSIEKNKEP